MLSVEMGEKSKDGFNLKNIQIPKKEISEKNKKILIATAVLFIAVLGLHFVLKSTFSPEKTVDTFVHAMNNKNYEEFSKITVLRDRNIELTEKSTAPMFNLYNEKGDFYQNVNLSLEEDLEMAILGEDLDEDSIVNLTSQNYLLFKKYKVSIDTGTFKFTSNMSNTKFSCAAGEVKVANIGEDAVLHGIIPGRYEVTAKSDQGNFGVFNKRESFSVDDISEKTVGFNFESCSLDMMKPEINVTSTAIYINDKKIEKLKDMGSYYEISPIPVDATVRMDCTNGNGTKMTYSYSFKNVGSLQDTAYPEFDLPVEELKTQYYNKIYWDDITDSSRLYEENFDYTPYNLNDDDTTTPWVEGASGYGKGENVTFYSSYNHEIQHIDINNGYAKNSNLYNKNAAIKRIKLEFSDGTEIIKELKNSSNTQEIQLNNPIDANWMRLTIIDVYPGSKFEDTCLSEVRVYES